MTSMTTTTAKIKAPSNVPAATVLAMLPITVRTRVEELIGSLKKTLGEDLESIVAYGSAVRGGYDAKTSNVDLVIVMAKDTPEVLESIGPALRIARAAARVEAVLLLHGEIARSADVFPLLYDDVRRCHAVLFGGDPFERLTIVEEHIRLRIEQELREARVAVRNAVAADGLAGPALAIPITKAVKKLRSPLHALLALKKRDVRDDLATVLRAGNDIWLVDTNALSSPSQDPNASLRALRGVLDAAIDDVDAMKV